jgi:hypothetical protein
MLAKNLPGDAMEVLFIFAHAFIGRNWVADILYPD